MMKSAEIRSTFLRFFESKQHQIVASAPMVIKNDPTLMFTNAGMNQFKDIFLGNSPVKWPRIADTQKCLRVSGKHNDLEEVGHDTYHHTMFEMLGNWSFGDYFKKEAIAWGWELLTEVYKINKEDLYVTVFGGDEADGMERDMEAFNFWKAFVPEERILFGSKKDNFWEMGDTGPCGPCSEIHADIRSEAERKAIPGRDLVNTGHPQVIEIWNLVFIEFNRMANGSLQKLPASHVDTGMGFERLCMVLQGKQSNYDTDVFQPLIQELAHISGKPYGQDSKVDVAMRVIADHLRAVSFAIADGQLPSNNKAGYVIRRILRRAVRYGFTFLDFREPFIHRILPVLVNQMGPYFPELQNQHELVSKVIFEEENNFLRTLAHGIQKFNQHLAEINTQTAIDGQFVFELFDTFGFPVDLTQLMAREQGYEVDMVGFAKCMEEQKERSRAAASKESDDWVAIAEGDETEFVGYDQLETFTNILRYRRVKTAKREFYQLVLDRTPFYAESGGQVGDQGYLEYNNEKIAIEDTRKENNLVVHVVASLPSNPSETFKAVVNAEIRQATANNHSATHLMHAALRAVLGSHVEQKGSLVDHEKLRFDFSHFSRLTPEEIQQVEDLVNAKIQANIHLTENRNMPIEKAREMGAMALFGEKYGDFVRVISFDPSYSTELCGGTHVPATGSIGLFKIISESAIAAGVRRIEAITANNALQFFNKHISLIDEVKELVKNPVDVIRGVKNLIDENKRLEDMLEKLKREKVAMLHKSLLAKLEEKDGYRLLITQIDADAATVKDLAFELKAEVANAVLLFAYVNEGKPGLSLLIADEVQKAKGWNAGQLVRDLAKDIQGGGGGQPGFATAGGSKPEGIEAALQKAKAIFI